MAKTVVNSVKQLFTSKQLRYMLHLTVISCDIDSLWWGMFRNMDKKKTQHNVKVKTNHLECGYIDEQGKYGRRRKLKWYSENCDCRKH